MLENNFAAKLLNNIALILKNLKGALNRIRIASLGVLALLLLSLSSAKAEYYYEYEWRRATLITLGEFENSAAKDCSDREIPPGPNTPTSYSTKYLIDSFYNGRPFVTRCEITATGQTTTTVSNTNYSEFCRRHDTETGTSQLVSHAICVVCAGHIPLI